MWAALVTVFRQSGLYSKQLNLFLVLAVIGFGAWGVTRYVSSPENSPQAATEILDSLKPQVDSDIVEYDVVINQDATVTVNGEKITGSLTYESGRGQFLLILTRDSEVYIDSLRSVVRLPKADPSAFSLAPRIYAIHGVAVAESQVIDAQTVQFFAEGVPPDGTVSIGLTFPDGYFNQALLGQVESGFSKLSLPAWIALGSLFPLLTLGFLLLLLVRRGIMNLGVRATDVAPKLPANIPPGMIGALYHARIGPREITATLFDLADRGFVTIYHGKDNTISFAKGGQLYTQKTSTLRPFEIFLLHQIFGDTQNVAHSDQIKISLESELFSSKVAMSMINLYDGLVAEGFYIKSPNRYFMRYQLIGMALFFIAAVGALYGSFVLPEPAFILFAWFGMMLASLLVVRITPGLPTRTQHGSDTLRQWMAFRNYLVHSDPVTGVQPSQFFDYLPYAIVLDCVDEWITRWRNEVIVLPHWLSSAETMHTADDYKNSLVSLIGYLSKYLISTRPPSVA